MTPEDSTDRWTCPPCHGDCNQGRTCPLTMQHPMDPDVPAKFTIGEALMIWFVAALSLCLLVGLGAMVWRTVA